MLNTAWPGLKWWRYNPVAIGDIDHLYIKMMADNNCVRVHKYGQTRTVHASTIFDMCVRDC